MNKKGVYSNISLSILKSESFELSAQLGHDKRMTKSMESVPPKFMNQSILHSKFTNG